MKNKWLVMSNVRTNKEKKNTYQSAMFKELEEPQKKRKKTKPYERFVKEIEFFFFGCFQ